VDRLPATVVAREDGYSHVLGKAEFEAALQASPSLREQIVRISFQRQR